MGTDEIVTVPYVPVERISTQPDSGQPPQKEVRSDYKLCAVKNPLGLPLSANMSETVTPWKFSVEGEAGSESDERIGAGPRWVGDRGGGEGDAAAVHGGVQAEDRQGGRRL